MKIFLILLLAVALGTLGFYAIEEGSVSKGTDELVNDCADAIEDFFSEIEGFTEEVMDDAKDGSDALHEGVQEQLEAGAKQVDRALEKVID